MAPTYPLIRSQAIALAVILAASAVGGEQIPDEMCDEETAKAQNGFRVVDDGNIQPVRPSSEYTETTSEGPGGQGELKGSTMKSCVMDYEVDSRVEVVTEVNLCTTASTFLIVAMPAACGLDSSDTGRWCGFAESSGSVEVTCSLVECIATLVFVATHIPNGSATCTTPANGECGTDWNHHHIHDIATAACHTAQSEGSSKPIEMESVSMAYSCYKP